MIFAIIALGVAIIAAVVFGVMYIHNSGCELIGATVAGTAAILLAVYLPVRCIEAKTNKALMQAHLENPTNYTYSQFAEHNALVTKLRVWHGTIFSFYNDVDLKTIDIDNISHKVIVENKENN